MRDVTERVEGSRWATAEARRNTTAAIFDEMSRLLTDREAYMRMEQAVNPYGDGTTEPSDT